MNKWQCRDIALRGPIIKMPNRSYIIHIEQVAWVVQIHSQINWSNMERPILVRFCLSCFELGIDGI